MKRVNIPANAKRRFSHDITIELDDDLEKDYDVVEKDFPADLPDSWVDPDDKQRKKISWISNFGLTKKADGRFEDKLPKGKKYKIELPTGLGKLVYFDGTSVQKLAGSVRGKKFEAELDLGDPPIGETT